MASNDGNGIAVNIPGYLPPHDVVAFWFPDGAAPAAAEHVGRKPASFEKSSWITDQAYAEALAAFTYGDEDT